MSQATIENDNLVSQPEKHLEASSSSIARVSENPTLRFIRDWTNILVASLPLLGALGTGFVWLVMTFYVGSVEIQPAKAFKSIDICTYDSKGAEFHFRSPHFQLMPGDYALLVSCDQAPGQLYNVHVDFKKTTTLSIAASDSPEVKQESKPETIKQKRWWHFWSSKR
jgi:hypothetical protein